MTLTKLYFPIVEKVNQNETYFISNRKNISVLFQFSNGYDIIFNTARPVEWNSSLNCSFFHSMWFSDPSIRNVDSLSPSSKVNFEISAQMSLFAYSLLLFNRDLIKTISFQFNNDGFYFVHPANQFSNFKEKFIPDCQYQGNNGKIDAKCLKSFQTLKSIQIISNKTQFFIGKNPDQYFRLYIPAPLFDFNNALKTEICSFVNNKNLELDAVLCIEYYFKGKKKKNIKYNYLGYIIKKLCISFFFFF